AQISRVAAEFASVRIIRLLKQRGFCVAANAGIKAAGGEIVELLNDDTEVTSGWAEAALACFADAQVAAVAPLVLRWSKEKSTRWEIDSAGDRYYLGGIAGKRGHGERLEAKYMQPCRVFGASASSAFYRKEVLLRAGAFPEFFQSYFEDVDLAFRIHRAGYHIQFEPRSQVYHHVASSYGDPRRRLLELQSLNEERVFWRNVGGLPLRDALPRHLLVLAGKAWQRCREGGLVPFLCGRIRLLGELAELRAHHRWLRTLGPEADLESWHVERQFWVDP